MKLATVHLDFDQLFALKQFADQIRDRHVGALACFGDSVSQGFRHTATTEPKADLSMSSTATSIISLVDTGAWSRSKDPDWLKDYAWLSAQPFWVGREGHYVEQLLTQEWTSAGLEPDNPFTVAFVVEACAKLREMSELSGLATKKFQKVEKKVKDRKDIFLEPQTCHELLERAVACLRRALQEGEEGAKPKGSISVLGYPPNAYLTQLVARALIAYQKSFGKGEEIAQGLENIGAWAIGEVERQIALIQAGSRAGDPLILAYAVICAVKYKASGQRTPTENELIRFGVKVFFSKQEADGTWPQSRPLFHYPRAGSAYCYDYELMAELIDCRELYDILFEYVPAIAKATYGLDLTKYEMERGTYCWASNQTSRSGPEAWSTACVYLYLHRLDRFIAEGVRQAIARELEAPYQGVREPTSAVFGESFLDCPVSAGDGEESSLKSRMSELLVGPLRKEKNNVAAGQKLPRSVKISAILFGPPGTSKTEIVEQIAQYVGWPAVTVDPSYFVKNGLDAIQAQANRIFRMLAVAEQMIILFDEFDEMVRNRANSDEILSRFLTTAMLPKLAQINKGRRILFIVATNYIESFDLAIARPGRFDLIFQMMPPKAAEKCKNKRWKNQLERLVKTLVSEDGSTDQKFLEYLARLTYLETDKLVTRINTELGEDTERYDAKVGRRIWTETLNACTLHRPHEQRNHPKQKVVEQAGGRGAELDEEFRAASPDKLTWLEAAVEDAARQRLQ